MVNYLRRSDMMLLGATCILFIIGIMMNISTSSVPGFTAFQDSYYFIKKHLVYVFLGTFAGVGGFIFPYRAYKKISGIALVVSIGLLGATLIPGIGITLGGASRWLNLGIISIQPIEIVKFFLAVTVAAAIENKKDQIRSFTHGILPILFLVALPIGILAIQPDLGNTILLLFVVGVMMFISRTRLWHLLVLGFSAVTVVVVNVLQHPYQLQRFTSFLSPWSDPLGKNYHIVQSLLAVGAGGIFGLGLGQSKSKYFYLPLHYTDFIFSVICEEGGFMLGVFVIGLFAFIFIRGMRIALKAQDHFGCLLAIALTLFLVVQACINIGVVIGVFPITGIPLTFISFGGTSLIMSLFMTGVLLNISRR